MAAAMRDALKMGTFSHADIYFRCFLTCWQIPSRTRTGRHAGARASQCRFRRAFSRRSDRHDAICRDAGDDMRDAGKIRASRLYFSGFTLLSRSGFSPAKSLAQPRSFRSCISIHYSICRVLSPPHHHGTTVAGIFPSRLAAAFRRRHAAMSGCLRRRQRCSATKHGTSPRMMVTIPMSATAQGLAVTMAGRITSTPRCRHDDTYMKAANDFCNRNDYSEAPAECRFCLAVLASKASAHHARHSLSLAFTLLLFIQCSMPRRERE